MTTDGIIPENAEIARRLEEVAALIEAQKGSSYRVQAYRHAAETIHGLPRPASAILQAEGLEGLEALPGIGQNIARAVRDLVVMGRLPVLDRLRGESDPVLLLSTVPGISRSLADRIHHSLGVNTLEDLETAAHDGRLTEFMEIRGKRLEAIKDSLAARLARVRLRREPAALPPIHEILDVDREYREGARAGTLPTIAPKRFNPEGRSWLPVLHTEREGRHYTALFSNTARAHELGKTADWVVIYYDRDRSEGQCTVITSERGPLEGRRIARGRETECLRYYSEDHTSEDHTPDRNRKVG